MSPLNNLLRRWHRLLGLQRQPKPWYRDRLREELAELRAAKSPIERLSESSDVFFTLSRSRYDGFRPEAGPLFPPPATPSCSSSFAPTESPRVGIYGLPGSGKTFLLNQLRADPALKDVDFYRPGYEATQAPRSMISPAKVPPNGAAVVSTGALPFKYATDSSMAKLLTTPMRNAGVKGPALREAHRQVGQLLSVDYLADLLGLEKYSIPHVQGKSTDGYRLQNEHVTGIIALMRGGEPMAVGVNDAFSSAALIHAKDPKDLLAEQVKPLKTVILVDSVINGGKSITEMVQRIRSIAPGIRIAVVAGVVQAKAVSEGPYALDKLAAGGRLCLVALRISENKFTGKGGTDTGNRLFNTMYLD